MKMKKELFDAKSTKLPAWTKYQQALSIGICFRAVKPFGCNLWFLERIAVTKTKWTVLYGKMGLLNWVTVDGIGPFLNEEKALSMARILIAKNANTDRQLVSDIIFSKG